jgi:hypothetical protein
MVNQNKSLYTRLEAYFHVSNRFKPMLRNCYAEKNRSLYRCHEKGTLTRKCSEHSFNHYSMWQWRFSFPHSLFAGELLMCQLEVGNYNFFCHLVMRCDGSELRRNTVNNVLHSEMMSFENKTVLRDGKTWDTIFEWKCDSAEYDQSFTQVKSSEKKLGLTLFTSHRL